jgi:hypothetical protein
MAYTVRDFAFQVYRLINAHNPTTPLHGDDEKLCILVLNQLLQYYSSDGLMITVAKTVSVPINQPINQIYFTDRSFPTITTQKEVVMLTSGSPSFNVENGGLYNIGDTVTGTGIPANTSILTIFGDVITLNQNSTFTGASSLTFTHDNTDPTVAYIKEGRLANLDSAWLVLSGVTYPLIDKNRDDFLAAWKYEPLKGLPRFIITFPDTQIGKVQLYPAPSQFYQFFCRGKFQLSELTSNDDMSVLSQYYIRFFLLACAKDVAMYKGRADAWTEKLEDMYIQAKDKIEAASEVNLSIAGDEQSLLNGAWRVRAGI